MNNNSNIKNLTKLNQLKDITFNKSSKNKYIGLKNLSLLGGTKESSDDSDMEIKFTDHLSEPWFSLIQLRLKTVEGRLNKGRFQELNEGDIVEWINDDFKHRSVKTRITGKRKYKTFAEYLEKEGLPKCLPGMPSLEHGLSVYFKYYTKEKEAEFGIVAIELEVI